MSDHLSNVWLIGAGPIARAHAYAARALGCQPAVIGRSTRNAEEMRKDTGLTVAEGGLASWLSRNPEPCGAAIVACDIESTPDVTVALLNFGVRRILIEKPGGVDSAAIASLSDAARASSADVFVAYNRRFLASTARARELIEEDGGVSSFSFEFTELSSVVEKTAHSSRVKANWFLANSSHVVDLAFFLCGRPAVMTSLANGALPWHPAARFAGSGQTAGGAVFHYGADWTSAGRWGVEINTPKRRLVLRPLEQLKVQQAGSFEIEDVPLPDESEKGLKPGFLGQLKAFLGGDDRLLLDIHGLRDLAENEYRAIVAGRDYKARAP
ncbi:MAG: Gfo/Idh/MocA family oxidoreductase [Pseudorhodoplanes sp.]|jgi:predicted dehydrogenase|nr:Gfo/Idh/MocA family oxidoreductase [Pseudorhodoplanes sp.]